MVEDLGLAQANFLLEPIKPVAGSLHPVVPVTIAFSPNGAACGKAQVVLVASGLEPFERPSADPCDDASELHVPGDTDRTAAIDDGGASVGHQFLGASARLAHALILALNTYFLPTVAGTAGSTATDSTATDSAATDSAATGSTATSPATTTGWTAAAATGTTTATTATTATGTTAATAATARATPSPSCSSLDSTSNLAFDPSQYRSQVPALALALQEAALDALQLGPNPRAFPTAPPGNLVAPTFEFPEDSDSLSSTRRLRWRQEFSLTP